jgi:uncharacterized protein with GYD domain
MPHYVRLVKLTREGSTHVKDLAKTMAKGRQYLESLGGRVVVAYALSGPYDFVAVIEAPSDEAVLKHGIYATQSGSVEILTMPAIPIEEFHRIVGEVPGAGN